MKKYFRMISLVIVFALLLSSNMIMINAEELEEGVSLQTIGMAEADKCGDEIMSEDFLMNAEISKEDDCFVFKGESRTVSKGNDCKVEAVDVVVIIPQSEEETLAIKKNIDRLNDVKNRRKMRKRNIISKEFGAKNANVKDLIAESALFARDRIFESYHSIVAASSGGSNSRFQWDSTGSIKAILTAYYDVNGKYAKITKVEGGFSGAGTGATISSGVRVVSQKVLFGQSGKTPSGVRRFTKTCTPVASQRSWWFGAPSTWQGVEKDVAMTTVGAILTITLKRGTSTWTVTCQNNIFHQGAVIF